MTSRVLVSDKLSPTAVQVFKDRGVDVDYLPDLGPDKEKLLACIGRISIDPVSRATPATPVIKRTPPIKCMVA